MVLIGYHSIGAYNLYSPKNDKLEINKYVLLDESKRWDCSHKSVQKESDTVTTVFEEDQQTKVTTNQNEEPP